jgi:hypothetical protein
MTQYRLAPKMCRSTGTGMAKNWAFSGVSSAPPVSSATRTPPAATGMRLSMISPAGMSHFGLAGDSRIVMP